MEYRLDQLATLAARLETFDYAHFLFHTETAGENRIALVVLFREPVASGSYSRVAACLIEDLGVYGVREGSRAATFLVKPTPAAVVVFNDGEVLDAEPLANSSGWNDAQQYEADAAPTMSTRRVVAAAVHAHMAGPFGLDGLFEG